MSEKTIAEMHEELEASGYKIRIQGTISSVITPDDMEIHLNDWVSHDTPQSINARLVKQAYAHLQERKELMALRAFVLEIAADITAPDISDIREDYNSAILKVFALIEQYNITAESEG